LSHEYASRGLRRQPDLPLRLRDAVARYPAKSFAAGDILLETGGVAKTVFMMVSGRVALVTRARNGRSVGNGSAGAGQLLGISGALTGLPSPTGAEAAIPSEVRLIPAESFRQIVRGGLELSQWLGDHLSWELHKSMEQMRVLALGSAEARIAYLLWSWAETDCHILEDGIRIPVHVRQQTLAEAAGLSRECSNRSLQALKRLGMVRFERGAIVLNQLAKLRSLADV
jgi:CRP/FNR family cyclic AMP-dependent transcriptional regulator